MSKYTSPLEPATRKKIDQILTNLGWNTDEVSDPNCNVFTERAKTKEQEKLLKKISGHKKPPDYVLYESGTDTPIAVIEAKRLGQSLDAALNQAITKYANPLGINLVFVSDGALIQTWDIRSKSPLYIDGQLITDFISESLLLRFVKEKSKIFTSPTFSHTKAEMITIFKDANDMLRKDGIRAGIDRFTEFSNLLFLKLISEMENEREKNRESRILEKKYCWESFQGKKPKAMQQYITKTILPKLVSQYSNDKTIFKKLSIKNPIVLKDIVDKLSTLNLLNTDTDVKGDAFEYFLKNAVQVAGTDLGEYFTPRHIVKLIVELLDPKFGDKVYDPCCGTGGFLIESFRHIKTKCKHTKNNLKELKTNTVYGNELTSTARIAKMNMIIVGDGHTNITEQDSLKNHIIEKYDFIMTNIPFSQKTDYNAAYGFSTNDANPVFLKHVIDALADGGKAGVVVPDGLLFDTNSEYVKVRKLLLETCRVDAVIQLHADVFKPYTGQPTCILIFEKGKQTKNVWFFDVFEDGFKKTGSKKGRSPIEKNDLILLRKIWTDKSPSKNSFIVSYDEIKNKNYKLTFNTHKPRQAPKNQTVPLGRICTPMIGGTPSRKNRAYWDDGENLWVTITDMNKSVIIDTEEKITDSGIAESNVKEIPPETLLFSFKLTIGKVGFSGKLLYTNEAIAALIPLDPKDKFIKKYLYYILPHIDFSYYAQRATKGFTLNSNTMLDIEIPFPSAKKREHFVKQIDGYEKKKKKPRKEIEKISSQQNDLIKSINS